MTPADQIVARVTVLLATFGAYPLVWVIVKILS